MCVAVPKVSGELVKGCEKALSWLRFGMVAAGRVCWFLSGILMNTIKSLPVSKLSNYNCELSHQLGVS